MTYNFFEQIEIAVVLFMELIIEEEILRQYIGKPAADVYEKTINNTLAIALDACFERPAIPPIPRPPVPAIETKLLRRIKLPKVYAEKWPAPSDLYDKLIEKLKLRFLAVDDKGQPLYDKQDLPAKMTKLTAAEFRAHVENILVTNCPRSAVNPDPWQLHDTPTGLELWWAKSFVDVAAKEKVTNAIYAHYEIERAAFISTVRFATSTNDNTVANIKASYPAQYDIIMQHITKILLPDTQIVDTEEAMDVMVAELEQCFKLPNIKDISEDVVIDLFTIVFTTICGWIEDGTINNMHTMFQNRVAIKIRRTLAKILPKPTLKTIADVKKYSLIQTPQ